MTSSARGTPATPENWLDAPPVSPTERIHLRALQGVQVLFLLLFLLAELRGESRGLDRLANYLLAAATLASFWQLRRGRFRTAVWLLLGATAGALLLALVATGLAAQLTALRYVVVPQLLAALTLGATALWVVTAALGLGIVVAAAIDIQAAPVAAGWLPAVQALVFVLIVALLLDRIGAALRRSFAQAVDRESRLEVARTELEARGERIGELYHRLESSYEETLRSLSGALDLRDRETRGHSARVVDYSLLLGSSLGLDDGALRQLRWGALLHDIGKIAVPDEILRKPGPLDAQEWAIVKRHPRQGFEMLQGISHLGPSLDVVLRHHEHWDGSGYPDGLEGEKIPRLARLFSVVDTYDAMSSGRPYRQAVADPEIRAELRRVAGTQLDPAIVEAFLALEPERLDEVRRRSDAAGSDSVRSYAVSSDAAPVGA